jgi:uncharacterized membrane protein
MNPLSDVYFSIFAICELCCLFTGVFLSILPIITRKSLLFGVRIPEAAKEDPDVRQMKRMYMAVMFSATFLTIMAGAWIYWLHPKSALLLCLYLPIVLIIIQFAVYIPLWKKTTNLKMKRGWQVSNIGASQTSVARSRERLKDLPWFWYIASTLLCVLALIISLYLYPTVPDTLITHWNANMEPDAWSHKSLALIFVMPLISFGTILIILGSNVIIYYTKLQVSVENPVQSFAQHRQYRRLTSHMLGFIALMITLMFLLMIPMTLNLYIPSSAVQFSVILLFVILMILPAVFLQVKAGQSGNRLKPVLTQQEERETEELLSSPPSRKAVNRGDDMYWKLGMFYYNKEDPSLFVEDRFGNNGGLNFARTTGKMIGAVIVLTVLATYVFSTILFVYI